MLQILVWAGVLFAVMSVLLAYTNSNSGTELVVEIIILLIGSAYLELGIYYFLTFLQTLGT